MPLLALLSGLTLALALAAAPAPRPLERADELAPPRDGHAAWNRRVELDGTLSVTAAGIGQAIEVLDGRPGVRPPSTDTARRAVALFALGAGGARGERGRLVGALTAGAPAERQAAALALGALRSSAAELLGAARDQDPVVAAAAWFALLLGGAPEADEAERAVALRAGTSADVAAIRAFFADRTAQAAASGTPSRYLELRWLAARDFGLIGGRSWRALVLRDLAADEAFIDEVVLGSLGRVWHPSVRDHLGALLLERPSPAAFTACLAVMPAELERMVTLGLFTPPHPDYWVRLLDEIELRGPDPDDSGLLAVALRTQAVAPRAAALLAEVGDPRGMEYLATDLRDEDASRRAFAVRAIGASRDEARQAELERAVRDTDVRVRAAAWLGRAREGERLATDNTRDALSDAAPKEERDAWIEELLANPRASRLRALLEEQYATLSGEQKLRAALVLSLPGRHGPRADVVRALADGTAGPHAVRALRVLVDQPSQEELDVLLAAFPDTRDRAFDVAAARALVSVGASQGVLFLRAGLWREPWHRSLLAGHILVQRGGIHALHEELQAAPLTAGSRDLRRIGYAIGTWGGTAQVEILARRRTSDDPALQGAYLGALSARSH